MRPGRLSAKVLSIVILLAIGGGRSEPLTDCNGNGIDDAVDIATGTSEDCDFNDIPDECATNVVFADSFPTEQLDVRKWELFDSPGLWVGASSPSPPYSVRLRTRDHLESEVFTVANTQNAVLHYYWSRRSLTSGATTADLRIMLYAVGESTTVTQLRKHTAENSYAPFQEESITLPPLAYGAPIVIRFTCSSSTNDSIMWLIDDVRVTADEIADCNATGVPDACELLGNDRNHSGLPDACESFDCNGNGVPDDAEIADGSAQDCDDNGFLDECEQPALTVSSLMPVDHGPRSRFGTSVAIDGSTALVGATHFLDPSDALPAVYVAAYADGHWQHTAKLVAADTIPGDMFGLAISVRGNRALIGAPWKDDAGEHSGAAYVFSRLTDSPEHWVEEAKLPLPESVGTSSNFGWSVALDGNLALVGAYYGREPTSGSGSAHLYRFEGASWRRIETFAASNPTVNDSFGWAVALEDDVLAISAPGAVSFDDVSGVVYVYRYNGEEWVEEAQLSEGDTDTITTFGYTLALNGDLLAVGDHRFGDDEGAVYVYRHNGTGWVSEGRITESNGGAEYKFGVGLSISGDALVIGNERDRAYLFRRQDGEPVQWVEKYLFPDEDPVYGEWFGRAVGIGGSHVLVGAFGANDTGPWSGKAWFFQIKDDCNASGSFGDCDIAEGRSLDCNLNLTPDECDTATGRSRDCNANTIPDECEADCNCNGLDDFVEIAQGVAPDCNGNAIPDRCDVSVFGTSLDCNANAVPDECDVDCNRNDIPDDCDVAAVTSWDCNSNGVPDECDIEIGTSLDCERNAAPDECSFEPFEFLDSVASINVDTLKWAVVSGVTVSGYGINEPSPPYSLRFNDQPIGLDDSLESVSLDLSGRLNAAFSYYWQRTGGGDSPESRQKLSSAYRAEDGTWRLVAEYPGDGPDMTEFAQEVIHLPVDAYHPNFAVRFWLTSPTASSFPRDDWFVDDVLVVTEGVSDCDGDAVPDSCAIGSGTDNDCDNNGLPDSCEFADNDCDDNQVLDACELADGSASDCNANNLPDICDLSPGGSSHDCNETGVPDECEDDCNLNGLADECDIAAQTSQDCNANGLPDECEEDCNLNAVIDDCEGPTGDVDGDGDVDLTDFLVIEWCLQGPCVHSSCFLISRPPYCCRLLDTDFDIDVDLVDYAVHQRNIRP